MKLLLVTWEYGLWSAPHLSLRSVNPERIFGEQVELVGQGIIADSIASPSNYGLKKHIFPLVIHKIQWSLHLTMIPVRFFIASFSTMYDPYLDVNTQR